MDRVMRLGALNVVTQPHSADRYHRLLSKVRNRKKAGRIRGDRFGLIALMSKLEEPNKPSSYVEGLIGAFTKINVDSDWLNVLTGKKAEGDELSELNIPGGLHPNAQFHRFRFYLKSHILVFEIGNSGAKLTPSNAGKLFERLFSAPSIVSEFGEVACTVFPSKDTIGKIVNSKSIRSLHLVVYAPNSDSGASYEKRYQLRLEQLDAQRMERSVVAKKSRNLVLDKELIEEAKVAATNGRVDAAIKVGNRIMKVSTVETPYVFTHEFRLETNTEAYEFGIAADRVIQDLKGD